MGLSERDENARWLILVVDDVEEVLRATSRVLRQAGYTVVLANNCLQAMSQFETRPPDLVILDFNMPDMKGDELYRKLRQRCPSFSALFLTGDVDAPLEAQLLTEGVLAVLRKPCKAELLLKEVEHG